MNKSIVVILVMLSILTGCKHTGENISVSESDNVSEVSSEFSSDVSSGHLSDDNTAGSFLSVNSEVSKDGNEQSVQSSSQAGTSTAGSEQLSSVSSAESRSSGNEEVLLYLTEPAQGSLVISSRPEFRWTCNTDAQSFTLIIEEYANSNYTLVSKTEGIRAMEYKLESDLDPNKEYSWRVEAVKDGATYNHYGSPPKGTGFFSVTDPYQHPANTGREYLFNRTISESVLKNYLSRAMTLSFISVPSFRQESEVRMIINTGAKYISRAIIPWQAETDYSASIDRYKERIDQLHDIDPDIILEACIFETVHTSCELVPIPSWVFRAFGKTAESRNFRYEDMLFSSGKYRDHWSQNLSIPDITKLETQMYFYYRACRYIDAGFEGVHWGQVMLMGEIDRNTGYRSWEKVINMVREYASDHARRKMVLNNAHTHGIIGPNGKLLFDFHSFPMRNKTPSGSVAHPPTESDPQITELAVGHLDSIYRKSLGGTTYSGWKCDSLPYFVEVDNYGGFKDNNKSYVNQPGHAMWPWGMDEISWYVNQPVSYRIRWLGQMSDWIRAHDKAGYLCMPGSRPYYSQKSKSMMWYYVTSTRSDLIVSEDEEAIRSIWINDNK